MFSRKALGLTNAALTVSDTVVHLPIRRILALNIAEQVREGYSYDSPERAWENLDQLLNFALEKQFRAPTPGQARLASLITSKLSLTPTDDVFIKKTDTELYINKYYDVFQELKEEEALKSFCEPIVDEGEDEKIL